MMASSSAQGLCAACARIDLRGPLPKRSPGRVSLDHSKSPSEPGHDLVELRHVPAKFNDSRDGSCSVCDIISWLLERVPAEAQHEDLLLVSTTWLQPGDCRFGPWDKSRPVLVLVRPKDIEKRDRHFCRALEVSRNPRFAFLDGSSQLGKTNPYLQPSRFKPDVLDYGQVKNWISICSEHEACRPQLSPILALRLIDCSTKEIVPTPKECQYVALSYVWGMDKSSVNINDGANALKNAPATIKDAISVTLGLGYRYLWVDRYCIDQNNIPETHAQVSQMGSIYRAAIITIIAVAGDSPGYGLPGAGSRSRDRQPRATLRNREVIGLLDEPRERAEKSLWATRGWTYQEALLSKRRLVFTHQQVFFECQMMMRDEVVVDPRTRLSSSRRSMFHTEAFGAKPQEVYAYISQYSSRQLTFVKDRLMALLGVFEILAQQARPVYHVHGVPILAPLDNTKEPLALSSSFVHSMTWHTTGSARRLAGFPSWSWLAWSGPVSWGLLDRVWSLKDLEHNPGGFISLDALRDIEIYIEQQDGNIKQLDSYDRSGLRALGDGISPPRVIYIETDAFDGDLVYLPEPLDETHRAWKMQLAGLAGRYWQPSSMIRKPVPMSAGYWITWIAAKGIRGYLECTLMDLSLEESLRAGPAKDDSFKVILLAETTTSAPSLIARVVRRKGDGYEVVGSMLFSWRSFYALFPTPEIVGFVSMTKEELSPTVRRERIRLL